MQKLLALILLSILSLTIFAQTEKVSATDAEQKAFMQLYIDAFAAKDLKKVQLFYDPEEFMQRIFKHVTFTSQAQEKSFKAGFKRKFVKEYPESQDELVMAHQLPKYLSKVNVDDFSGHYIRAFDEDYSPIYLGFVIKKKQKKMVIVDTFDLVEGAYQSNIIAKLINRLVNPEDSFLKRLGQRFSGSKTEQQKLVQLMKLLGEEKLEQAYRVFETLPEDTKNHEDILSYAITITQNIESDEPYLEVLSRLAKHHGDKPKYAMLLIDYYSEKGMADEAYAAVNVFEKRIKEDAGTNLMKSLLALNFNNWEEMRRYAKRCIELESDLEKCYDYWIHAASKLKDYEDVVTAYDAVGKQLGLIFVKSDFSEEEDGEFVHSAAFEQWEIPEN